MPLNKSGMGWRTEAIEDFAMSKDDTRSSEGIKGFVRVSREALAILNELPSAASKVYLLILAEASYKGRKVGTSSFSYRYIAEHACLDKSDVCRAVRKLAEAGLIVIKTSEPMTCAEIVHWCGNTNTDTNTRTNIDTNIDTNKGTNIDTNNLKEVNKKVEEGNKKEEESPPPLDPQDIPEPYPEAPSYLLISRRNEERLIERFGGEIACSALENIKNWLEAGNTPTALKARERKDHYLTVLNCCKDLQLKHKQFAHRGAPA